MGSKCDVPWCKAGAAWIWQRTPAELKSMRGPKGAKAQPERILCDAHRPAWRAEAYVPLGQVRKAGAPAAKSRAARKAAPGPSPALEAVLSELAATRAELAEKQAKLTAYAGAWSMLRERSEELRLARIELAAMRQPLDLASELLPAA